MRRQDFLEFCDHLYQHQSLQDFYQHVDHFVQTLGFDRFFYSAVPSFYAASESKNDRQGLIGVSSFDRGWLDYYRDKHYERDDISVDYCLSGATQPFIWYQSFKLNDLSFRQREVYRQAGEVGLKSGVSLPMHQLGVISAISITSSRKCNEFGRLYQQQMDMITTFSSVLNDAILSQHAMVFGEPHVPKLTNREKDVLNWLCWGYNYEQIARKLMVGISTIRKHVSCIIQKLKARNGAHACALALRWGMVK